MPELAESTVPRLRRHFRMQWEEAQACHVLLYPEGMVKLSQSAGEIMRRVDGVKSVSAMVAALQVDFPGVDLRADVVAFLETARERGWIEFT